MLAKPLISRLAQFIQHSSAELGDNVEAANFAQQTQQEISAAIRIILESNLGKMNLVSREEFDAQCEVLARTRRQLEALEQQLETLQQSAQTHTK